MSSPAYSTTDHTQNPDQNAGTNERDNDTIDQAAGRESEQAHDEAADKGTNDTYDDITNYSVSPATHYDASKKACNETREKPD